MIASKILNGSFSYYKHEWKSDFVVIGHTYRFHDFTISRFHDFTISRFHDFTISRFHDFTIFASAIGKIYNDTRFQTIRGLWNLPKIVSRPKVTREMIRLIHLRIAIFSNFASRRRVFLLLNQHTFLSFDERLL